MIMTIILFNSISFVLASIMFLDIGGQKQLQVNICLLLNIEIQTI